MPIIVLTSLEATETKVSALDAGADDYLTKPFAPEELVARMRAVWRRTARQDTGPVLRFGELEIDSARHLVHMEGRVLKLTPKEYGVLEALARHPGKLLTQELLLRSVWGPQYGTESNYLRVYVAQLRKKLGDDATRPRLIQTEPGIGYRWIARDGAHAESVE